MKVRTGFVSNSSTSSFCIYGTSYDYQAIRKAHADDEDFDIEEYAGSLGLEIHAVYDYDSWYVGLPWDNIGDDETGSQFKQRVKELVQKFIGITDIKLCTIERAWYNG